MTFEYMEESDDKLSQKLWIFSLTDDAYIVLDYYYEKSRETKRHKFKIYKSYIRLLGRDCQLSLSDVNIPNFVAGNIISQINCKLRFVSDYRGTPLQLGE